MGSVSREEGGTQANAVNRSKGPVGEVPEHGSRTWETAEHALWKDRLWGYKSQEKQRGERTERPRYAPSE